MKKLAAPHIKKCSGLTVCEYKKKYGLYLSKGLVSDETSYKLALNAIKNRKGRLKLRQQSVANGLKYGHRSRTLTEASLRSMQYKNKYGTCPDQIKARLREFILANKELPAPSNRGYPLYKVMTRRFGSFPNGMAHFGLPYRIRQGTNLKFIFSDGTKWAYNLNQPYDRTALYNMMLQKCDLLKNNAL